MTTSGGRQNEWGRVVRGEDELWEVKDGQKQRGRE